MLGACSRFALVQRRHQRLAEAANSRAQLLVDLVVIQLPAFMNTGLRLVHMLQYRELQATQWRRLRGGGCADHGLHGTQQADRSTAAATDSKTAPHGEAASAGALLLQSCRMQRLWSPEAGPASAADPAMWTLAKSAALLLLPKHVNIAPPPLPPPLALPLPPPLTLPTPPRCC